ncbi:MAG: type II toxin-antitoxin system RelE/ParE family toxin [Proteobacteria bacterium]|nr:type II toxin-antitoxin system RelE/ParE family toxin [Pseudomonadota bacterium]
MFKLTNAAYADLKNIALYTTETWGTAQRNVYLQMMDATFRELAISPKIGTNIDDVRKGYFKYPAGKHLIFYRVIAGGIEIVRILHHSMDVDSQI